MAWTTGLRGATLRRSKGSTMAVLSWVQKDHIGRVQRVLHWGSTHLIKGASIRSRSSDQGHPYHVSTMSTQKVLTSGPNQGNGANFQEVKGLHQKVKRRSRSPTSGQSVKLRSTVNARPQCKGNGTILGHYVGSQCEGSVWGHSVRSVCGVTVWGQCVGHSVRSVCVSE